MPGDLLLTNMRIYVKKRTNFNKLVLCFCRLLPGSCPLNYIVSIGIHHIYIGPYIWLFCVDIRNYKDNERQSVMNRI